MYHTGDFIIRVKNAYRARRKQVSMPFSKNSKAIAQVLVKEGFLSKVETVETEAKRHS